MTRRLAALLTLSLTITHFAARSSAQDAKPIQDNSFLLEEAYNQERGVVQHISAFQRSRSGDWTYTFTQEWPVPDQKHQFSYTVPVERVKPHTGVGDIGLNYRYQLIGDADAAVAVAPRFSLLLPTGDERKDLGAGGAGLQVNLPASVVVNPKLVTHWNAGMTYTRSARNAGGAKGSTTDLNLGQSFVWLVRPTLNLLFETVWNSVQSIESENEKSRKRSLFINPGVRWAYNLETGLQIVPGIAFPIGIGPSRDDYGVFFYLSFEHPFSK
jgi:hypothetical protein